MAQSLFFFSLSHNTRQLRWVSDDDLFDHVGRLVRRSGHENRAISPNTRFDIGNLFHSELY